MAVEKATIKKDKAIKRSPTYTMDIACFGLLQITSLQFAEVSELDFGFRRFILVGTTKVHHQPSPGQDIIGRQQYGKGSSNEKKRSQ